jgi:3-hydroxyisobutyrate dehydrogenase
LQQHAVRRLHDRDHGNALGGANGIDPAVLSEVLRTSSGGNCALEKYSPYPGIMPNVPSSNGFKGGFARLQLKDMRLAKRPPR